MPHTELTASRDANSLLLDVTYEEVRQSFLARLQGDEAQLTRLCAALDSAELDPESAFVDLGLFAHRLRGAAAVFGLPEIRDAAKALELAAASAAISGAAIDESVVQEAIRLLATRLTCLNGFMRTSDALATPVPVN